MNVRLVLANVVLTDGKDVLLQYPSTPKLIGPDMPAETPNTKLDQKFKGEAT